MTSADIDAIVTAYRTGHDPDGEDGINIRLVPHTISITRHVKGRRSKRAATSSDKGVYLLNNIVASAGYALPTLGRVESHHWIGLRRV